jgi:NADPH-dependent 7-cyano-7-deazaguanine reductase QueF-like protein
MLTKNMFKLNIGLTEIDVNKDYASTIKSKVFKSFLRSFANFVRTYYNSYLYT